jgi:hypothetical protein
MKSHPELTNFSISANDWPWPSPPPSPPTQACEEKNEQEDFHNRHHP